MPIHTASVFGGINNRLSSDRLGSGFVQEGVKRPPESGIPVEYLTVAENVDITDAAEIETRLGSELKLAGAISSLWSNGSLTLCVISGALHRLNTNDFTTQELVAAIGSDVTYEQIDDWVYFSDGVSVTGVTDGSTVRPWGLSVPSSPQVLPISGNLTEGCYQVSITHESADGRESGASLPSIITVADNAGLAITWTAPSDPSIVQVNIYVSGPNATDMYRVSAAPSDVTAFNYTDQVFGIPLDTEWAEPAPIGTCMACHKGRILLSDGEFLRASRELDYDRFDSRDFIPVPGTILFIKSLEVAAIIGTTTGVYRLDGDSFSEFRMTELLQEPPIAGSEVLLDAEKYFDNVSGTAVIFATAHSFYVATESGELRSMASERYEIGAAVGASAAMVATADKHQYLLFKQS